VFINLIYLNYKLIIIIEITYIFKLFIYIISLLSIFNKAVFFIKIKELKKLLNIKLTKKEVQTVSSLLFSLMSGAQGVAQR
jgi:hypothetical protein